MRVKYGQSRFGVVLKPRYLLYHVLDVTKNADVVAALLLKSEIACAMNEKP
jgi:hypothetical protein